jgi:hypothetical protein
MGYPVRCAAPVRPVTDRGSLTRLAARGRDCLPPTIVDIVPIDDIDSVGHIAIAESLLHSSNFIERQSPAGTHRQIEIGITPRPPGRPRAVEPNGSHRCPRLQIRSGAPKASLAWAMGSAA